MYQISDINKNIKIFKRKIKAFCIRKKLLLILGALYYNSSGHYSNEFLVAGIFLYYVWISNKNVIIVVNIAAKFEHNFNHYLTNALDNKRVASYKI